MPQDLGYGVRHWGANETEAFHKYWDSPQRKQNAARKKAEYDAMSPKQQADHRAGQKQIRRDMWLKRRGGKSPGQILREKAKNNRSQHPGAWEQQKARRADPNSKRNQKLRRREARQQRMAGDALNIDL